MDSLLAALQTRLPLALRGARVPLGRRAGSALCVLVALAVAFAVVLVVHGRAQPATLSAVDSYASGSASGDPGAASGSGSGTRSSSAGSVVGGGVSSAVAPAATRQIVVDVEGKVKLPGVHSVASTARIQDVLTAAGGALPGVDVTTLDLAERVSDGQQIRVGLPGAAAGAPDPAGDAGASAGPSAPVNLNTATATELDALPGIGPATAAKIIAWREAHGDFASVGALAQVPGFGGKKLATLAPLLTV